MIFSPTKEVRCLFVREILFIILRSDPNIQGITIAKNEPFWTFEICKTDVFLPFPVLKNAPFWRLKRFFTNFWCLCAFCALCAFALILDSDYLSYSNALSKFRMSTKICTSIPKK